MPKALRTTLIIAAALAAAAFLLCHTLDPTGDQAVEFLIYATAPPATLFALIYGFTTPWYRTMIGRALLTSSTALALLVDVSLLFQWLGPEYLGRAYVRLIVFGLVCLGAWLKFSALIGQKWDARKERRG